jgi:hypothetical protein
VNELALVHGFTFFHSLGGVQSMLRRHLEGDASHSVASEFLAYFDGRETTTPRVQGLGLSWKDTIRSARGRFKQARPARPAMVAYHNCWGLPFFADLDGAQRRIGVLHSDWPGLPECLRRVRGLLDGMLCVSQPLVELARRECPELGAERVAFLPYPAGRAGVDTRKPSLRGRPLALGFVGRLSREQKRVDRFPALLRELDRTGLDYRFEFLGDGPEEGWLRQRLGGNSRVGFHSRLSGDSYWRVLQSWDVVVFASDYEGLPISMLEALSVGVLPVFPRIGCGGDDFARRLGPGFLYAPEDFPAVAKLLAGLTALSDAEAQALRDRGGELARPHLGDCYLSTFADFARRIAALPRISNGAPPPRPFYPSDLCPFALLRRVYPMGFWRGPGAG